MLPTGQVSPHVRATAAALPRVSLQVSEAVVGLVPPVQVKPMFCAVVVEPTNDRLTPATEPKLPGPLVPLIEHPLTVVVAFAPLPLPAAGVAAIVAVPLAKVTVAGAALGEGA